MVEWDLGFAKVEKFCGKSLIVHTISFTPIINIRGVYVVRKIKLVYTSKFRNYKINIGVCRKIVLASFVVHLFYTATIRISDADQLL